MNEHLGKPQVEQLVEEVNEDLNEGGLHQPPNSQKDNSRGRQRLPENLEHKNRYRYDVSDRRYRQSNYRLDYYDNRSDSSENYQLTASQRMEAKLFLDKILYFGRIEQQRSVELLSTM